MYSRLCTDAYIWSNLLPPHERIRRRYLMKRTPIALLLVMMMLLSLRFQ
jgi:hypothetical protein